MKLWWPQAEAMVAFAKAYEATGEEAHLLKFAQVAEWTYGHLVTDKEWYGYADRTGAVTHRVRLRLIARATLNPPLTPAPLFRTPPVQRRALQGLLPRAPRGAALRAGAHARAV